jgi:hypothetical protein
LGTGPGDQPSGSQPIFQARLKLFMMAVSHPDAAVGEAASMGNASPDRKYSAIAAPKVGEGFSRSKTRSSRPLAEISRLA